MEIATALSLKEALETEMNQLVARYEEQTGLTVKGVGWHGGIYLGQRPRLSVDVSLDPSSLSRGSF